MGLCCEPQESIPVAKPQDDDRSIRLVIVGETTVGKTCLITNFNTSAFSTEHIPSVLDVFRGTRDIGDHQVKIEIVDTSGDSLLGSNRQLVYGNTDCFMLCVAFNNRDSLDRVMNFKNEIRSENQDAPVVLVGTKSDMRDGEEDCLTKEDLDQQSIEHGFSDTLETSSKNWQDKNVKKAFNRAIKLAYYWKYPAALQ